MSPTMRSCIARWPSSKLWDTATYEPIGAPLQHQDAVAFSPDGKSVLTGSFDTTARLWEASTGKQIGAPLQHQDSVNAVAFSPDGKTVLTGSADKTARLWQVPRPIRGTPRQIILWTQVITGLELDEHGAVRLLDAKTWQQRQYWLQEIGGPPEW